MSVSVVALVFRRIFHQWWNLRPDYHSLEWRQHFQPQTGHNVSDFPSLPTSTTSKCSRGAASRLFELQPQWCHHIVTKKAKNDGVSASTEGWEAFGSFGAQDVQTALKTGKWTQAYSVSGGYKRSDGGTENSDREGQGFRQSLPSTTSVS